MLEHPIIRYGTTTYGLRGCEVARLHQHHGTHGFVTNRQRPTITPHRAKLHAVTGDRHANNPFLRHRHEMESETSSHQILLTSLTVEANELLQWTCFQEILNGLQKLLRCRQD